MIWQWKRPALFLAVLHETASPHGAGADHPCLPCSGEAASGLLPWVSGTCTPERKTNGWESEAEHLQWWRTQDEASFSAFWRTGLLRNKHGSKEMLTFSEIGWHWRNSVIVKLVTQSYDSSVVVIGLIQSTFGGLLKHFHREQIIKKGSKVKLTTCLLSTVFLSGDQWVWQCLL